MSFLKIKLEIFKRFHPENFYWYPSYSTALTIMLFFIIILFFYIALQFYKTNEVYSRWKIYIIIF